MTFVKWAVAFFAFISGVIGLQILLLLWMVIQPSSYNHHDAIVVFAGGINRTHRGYQLAQMDVASALIISPAGRGMLRLYERQYGRPGNADYIIESKADTVGIPHVVALSSGTAAMHLALRNLGIGPGDEVLASTLTFIGSVTPIVFQGATPVFIDADVSPFLRNLPKWITIKCCEPSFGKSEKR